MLDERLESDEKEFDDVHHGLRHTPQQLLVEFEPLVNAIACELNSFARLLMHALLKLLVQEHPLVAG